MPVYCFICDCGHTDEVMEIVSRRGVSPCPVCGKPMKRDYSAEGPRTQKDWQKPLISNAMGVNKADVKRAQKAFPHHRYTKGGDMIIGSSAEMKRNLRDLGYVDKNPGTR